jgi:hypothetical protein
MSDEPGWELWRVPHQLMPGQTPPGRGNCCLIMLCLSSPLNRTRRCYPQEWGRNSPYISPWSIPLVSCWRKFAFSMVKALPVGNISSCRCTLLVEGTAMRHLCNLLQREHHNCSGRNTDRQLCVKYFKQSEIMLSLQTARQYLAFGKCSTPSERALMFIYLAHTW